MALSKLESLWQALAQGQDLANYIMRRRDLTLVPLGEGYVLVIACDSNSAIGQKEADYVRRDYPEVGRCAAKVPLMEVIAAGGFPMVVVDNLCVEMDPSGRGLLEGIRFELQRLGLDPAVVLTGSVEKNMITRQTGLGVTVIGLAREQDIHIGSSLPGDVVACVGVPKSAPSRPFFEGEPDIMDPPTTRRIRALDFIHDLLPVGSQGVRYEAKLLAQEAGCRFVELDSPVDMTHSAGPSTCVLASLPEVDLPRLAAVVTHPVALVGFLEKE